EVVEVVDRGERGVRRYGKADADRTAGGRDDRGIHSDHLALEIEQRPARIAAVDRGVGLNVVVVRSRIDIAIARGHDPGGDSTAQAERDTDRNPPFDAPEADGNAELDRLQRLVRP